MKVMCVVCGFKWWKPPIGPKDYDPRSRTVDDLCHSCQVRHDEQASREERYKEADG